MILIAYDGSADATHAIEAAGKLFPGADATIITVWHRLIDTMARSGMGVGVILDYDEIDTNTETESLKTANGGAELATAAGLSASARYAVVETTTPEAILHAAALVDADAIVLGSRGLGGVRSVMLGSVSMQVLHHADRPVVVVPAPEIAAERAAHLSG